MSFFKDFKADFAQAVNELIPDSEEMTSDYEDDDMVNTFDEAPDAAAQPGVAAAPPAASGTASDAIAAEDAMDIAPEDLIDDIDDVQGSAQTPAGDSADVQMSFDFLSNALGATDGDEAVPTGQTGISVQEAAMPADDTNTTETAGVPEAEGAQVIDFAKNFAEALQAEQPAAPSVGAASVQDTTNTQASVEETSPAQAAAPSPEAIAQQMGIMQGMTAAQPDAMPESAAVQAGEEAVQPDAMPESAAVQAGEEAAQPDAMPEQAEEKTDVVTELPASEEAVNIQNQKEEEAMVKVAEVSESTETFEENDESTTYITKSTKITGDVETEGSIDIIGSVVGNVVCRGKLVIGGTVQGNVRANEVYANAARIEGDVVCEGSAKIGVGSVIIGKVEGASAVIAGAVNGDIDVQGPVIVDSTAVIMGNIKSKSVQINNGAVIEGFCSQSYSEIDVKSFFA